MPKVKSKGSNDNTNEDGSGITTRSNSVDADADQSNSVNDDVTQNVSNNPSHSGLLEIFFHSEIYSYFLL